MVLPTSAASHSTTSARTPAIYAAASTSFPATTVSPASKHPATITVLSHHLRRAQWASGAAWFPSLLPSTATMWLLGGRRLVIARLLHLPVHGHDQLICS